MAKITIDRALLERVAKNSRIKLSEKEITEFLPQLQGILDAFSKLDKLDVSKEKASFQPLPVENIWRTDKTGNCLSQEQALSLTQHKKDSYFKGPRVV